MEERGDHIEDSSRVTPEGHEKPRDYFLPVSILAAAVMISGSILYTVGRNDNARNPGLAAIGGVGAPDVSAIELSGRDVILGDPDAPVTFVEYGDFQCPFCRQIFMDTEKALRDEYVKTGKMKMVYRDFPLDSIHPYARSAAEAAECAKDQGKYWAYHDALYERQSSIPSMDFVDLAKELGFDTASFGQCFTSGQYRDDVEKDFQGGIALGVQSTPTVFVNGFKLVGAQPLADFREIIESELQKQ